jgi:AAT family amino acid transporter
MSTGVWLNHADPAGAFTYITALRHGRRDLEAGVILAAPIRYRAAVRGGRAAAAWFTAPGGAAASRCALAFLALATVVIGADSEARTCLYEAPPWFAALAAGYRVLRRRNPAAFTRHPHLPPGPGGAPRPPAACAPDAAAR